MPKSHLTAIEREVIDRMNYAGESRGKIAIELGRSKSVISRELKRNRDPTGNYSARKAGEKSVQRRVEAKSAVVHWFNIPRLFEYVTSRLHQDWSPEQICGRLQKDHPEDASMRVSHDPSTRGSKSNVPKEKSGTSIFASVVAAENVMDRWICGILRKVAQALRHVRKRPAIELAAETGKAIRWKVAGNPDTS